MGSSTINAAIGEYFELLPEGFLPIILGIGLTAIVVYALSAPFIKEL